MGMGDLGNGEEPLTQTGEGQEGFLEKVRLGWEPAEVGVNW